MNDTSWQNELGPLVRTLQIIVAALIGGCVMFFVVVLVVPAPDLAGDGSLVLTGCAIFFALMMVIARAVIPGMIVGLARRKIRQGTWNPFVRHGRSAICESLQRCGDAGKLAMLAVPRLIVSAALLEGAIFLLLVTYMIERSPWSLLTAAVLIVGLLLHIPTRGRIARWIEDQLRLLEQERQFGP